MTQPSMVSLESGLTLSCSEQGDPSGPALVLLPGSLSQKGAGLVQLSRSKLARSSVAVAINASVLLMAAAEAEAHCPTGHKWQNNIKQAHGATSLSAGARTSIQNAYGRWSNLPNSVLRYDPIIWDGAVGPNFIVTQVDFSNNGYDDNPAQTGFTFSGSFHTSAVVAFNTDWAFNSNGNMDH